MWRTLFDPDELLQFSVTSNPPPMRELSPYKIEPSHLHGFLQSEAGQFRLTALADGSTMLEGTRYRHNLWPEKYWQLWSDYIIHKIHLRVLDHIRRLSQGESEKVPHQE